MDQYRSKGGDDNENWLSIYSNESIKISRATKETAFIPSASVSILGGIQPSVLKTLAKGANDDNGFTYRFCFIYPRQSSVPDWIDRDADFRLIAEYEKAVLRLALDTSEPGVLPMSPDAKTLWVTWYDQNAKMIRALNKGDKKRSIYKKLEAQVVRSN